MMTFKQFLILERHPTIPQIEGRIERHTKAYSREPLPSPRKDSAGFTVQKAEELLNNIKHPRGKPYRYKYF